MAAGYDIRYSYEDVPTIREFAASNAFVRGLMGPLGSGKSAGCIIELVRRAMQQRPGPDGIRRSRWVVVRNCFDDQTEILTKDRGWQLFRYLQEDDEVATLKDGHKLTYEKPSYYYAAHYAGEMIGAQSDGIDFLVTPDHHLWTSTRRTRKKIWAPYVHEKASDAYGNSLRRFKRDGDWHDGSAAPYDVPFFEFLGFWFAKGSAGVYDYGDRNEPHYRLNLTTTDKAYARELLGAARLRYGESPRSGLECVTFRISVEPNLKALVRELAALGDDTRKHVPGWIKSAPRAYIQAFLKGYLKGDGSDNSGEHTSLRAHTTSKRLADDLQELALKAGMVANVGSGSISQGSASFRSNAERMYYVTFLSDAHSEPTARGWYKQPYDGMVYCVEVSTHVVYVRRNGKAMWSGQTYGMLRDTTINSVFQWLPPQYCGKYNSSEHKYTIKCFAGVEFEILFRALDKPDDVRNLLSLEVTGGWINEAREVPWAIMEALQGRCGRYPAKKDGGASWFGLWMDTNPPDTESEWYDFFENRNWIESFQQLKRDGFLPANLPEDQFAAIFKQPSGLDPRAENIPNLPGERLYYARLAAGKKKEWVKVFVHGQYGFVVEGLPVYDNYIDDIHCKRVEPVSGPSIIRSFDFGLTPACAFSQILPDGRWLTFNEMVSKSMGIDRFSDDVLEHCQRAFRGSVHFEDWGDPAGMQRAQTDERTCFDILHGKGIMIRGSEQNPKLRQESVRSPMNRLHAEGSYFVLNPRCKVLRKGFLGGYHHRQLKVSGAVRYSEDPEKNSFSHIHDALQYGMAPYFAPQLTAPMGYDPDWPMNAQSEEDFISDASRSSVTGY